MLLILSWVWGSPLEHGQLSRGYPLKEDWLFLPWRLSVSIAPQLGWTITRPSLLHGRVLIGIQYEHTAFKEGHTTSYKNCDWRETEMSRAHLVKMQAIGMVENHSMIDCTLVKVTDLSSRRETMGLVL